MTKVLVLGSNGQLGCDLLSLKGTVPELNVQALTRLDVDVSKHETVFETLSSFDFDVLVNCTSFHKTDEVEDNADTAFAINAFSVREMAKACCKKGALLIHISTDYVFSGFGQQTPYRETDNVGATTVYGASKNMGETLAMIHNPDTYILRVASLFGVAGASGKGGNFVETMIKFGKEKGELNVVDDIKMSPTSTLQVARFIFDFIKKRPQPGVYHAVNSGEATWYEFAAEIIRQANIDALVKPCTSAQYPTKALRPAYSVLANDKVQKIYGDIPTWKEALSEYLKLKGHVS